MENPAEEEGGQEGTADMLEGEYIEDDEDWKDEQREDGDGEVLRYLTVIHFYLITILLQSA